MHHATWAAGRTLEPRLAALIVCAAAARVRFLVTGATGFIGRRLVAEMLRRHESRSIACFVHEVREPLARERDAASALESAGVHIIRGDLTRDTVSNECAPSPDVVYHLAANIDTYAREDESRVIDAGTANLLRWIGERLRGTRVVYASSVAVCDRAGRSDGPLNEDSPSHPRTVYGRTKLRGESIIREASSRLGFTYTILRLPTVYGPGQKRDGMFDLLMRYAAQGAWLGRINWPGRTSILHVDDAARLMVELAGRQEAADQTFCAASDEHLTVGEIARRIGSLTGHPVMPIDLPAALWAVVRWIAWNRAIAAVMPRSAKVAHWRLGLIADDGFWQSADKLRRIYPGPLTTLDEGMATIVERRANEYVTEG
jgi:nucleoside-diphosphate-sugar epimerase